MKGPREEYLDREQQPAEVLKQEKSLACTFKVQKGGPEGGAS